MTMIRMFGLENAILTLVYPIFSTLQMSQSFFVLKGTKFGTLFKHNPQASIMSLNKFKVKLNSPFVYSRILLYDKSAHHVVATWSLNILEQSDSFQSSQ